MIATFIILAIVAEIIGTVGGFGSSLFFVPLAGFFFDVKTVLGITAVFHVFSNLVKLVLFRKTIDLRLTLLFGIPSVVFVIIGAWLTTRFAFGYEQIILAVFLIVFSSVLLARPDLTVKADTTSSVIGGGLSGFLAGYLGTGGAVRGLAMAAYNLEKNLFVGTSAAIDMGVDLSRTVIYMDSGFVTKENYYLIPLLIGVSIVGSYIGKLLLKRVSQNSFKKLVLGLILAVGIISLVYRLAIIKY